MGFGSGKGEYYFRVGSAWVFSCFPLKSEEGYSKHRHSDSNKTSAFP